MAFETSRDTATVANGYQDLLDKMVTFMDANGWDVLRDLDSLGVTAVALVSGGTGYTVSDTLTLVGGTGTAATLTVTAVSSGVITAASVATHGSYSVAPSGTLAVTGGTGSGATFTASVHGEVNEKQVILQSSDDAYVGVRTFRDADTGAFQWSLRGFTGYVAENSWATQPGASVENVTGGSGTEDGCFVPLVNAGTNIHYWWNSSSRRICGCLLVNTTYLPFYLGFVSPFVTSGEWPYPLFVGGCLNRSDILYSETTPGISGPVDPIKYNDGDDGPCQLRSVDGAWYTVANGQQVSGSNRQTLDGEIWVYPTGYGAAHIATSDDDWITQGTGDNAVDNRSIMPHSLSSAGVAINAQPSVIIEPTTDSGGDVYTPVQCIIVGATPSTQLYAEIDQMYWVTGSGLSAEDTIDDGVDTFHVFPNGNRSEVYNWWCLKED